MTLLNGTNDGFFNVLIIIAKTLANKMKVGINAEKLIELCTVPGENNDALQNTFNKWKNLNFFKEVENGNIIFNTSNKIDEILRNNPREIDLLLPTMIRTTVFSAVHNKNFFENPKNGAADFVRALAWFLAQDIYKIKVSSSEIDRLASQQISDPNLKIFLNSSRHSPFFDWARYLGFLSDIGKQIIDPTEALLQDFKIHFKAGEEFQAKQFVERVLSICPVVDGGEYRKKIEDKLKATVWKKIDKENKLSSSLSFSIRRLEHMKVLELTDLSDAPTSVQLTKGKEENWGAPFNKVKYIGEVL